MKCPEEGVGELTRHSLGEVVDIRRWLFARHAVAGKDADLVGPLLAHQVDDLLDSFLVGSRAHSNWHVFCGAEAEIRSYP